MPTQTINLKDLQRRRARARERRPSLLVIEGASAGKIFPLVGPLYVIGRDEDVGIRLEDEDVSRRHAQVTLQDGRVELEDLGSTNGTHVNGAPITKCVLAEGDKILLGLTTTMKFAIADLEEEAAQRNLYESATRDALTTAFNKKYFLEHLSSDFAFSARHETELSLAIIDLDHFKKVNDTYGHPAGDAVLKNFSQVVHSCIRKEDIFCRYGGEEFTLILRDTSSREAMVVIERVHTTLRQRPCTHEGVVIPVTCSIGLATQSGAKYATPEELLKIADGCVYRAKDGGRNQTIVAP